MWLTPTVTNHRWSAQSGQWQRETPSQSGDQLATKYWSTDQSEISSQLGGEKWNRFSQSNNNSRANFFSSLFDSFFIWFKVRPDFCRANDMLWNSTESAIYIYQWNIDTKAHLFCANALFEILPRIRSVLCARVIFSSNEFVGFELSGKFTEFVSMRRTICVTCWQDCSSLFPYACCMFYRPGLFQ